MDHPITALSNIKSCIPCCVWLIAFLSAIRFQTLECASYNDWVNKFKAKLHSSIDQWIDLAGATAGQLLRSLRDKAAQWWYFLDNPEVPPDNNQAERSLRLAVTKRKVNGGSRSMERFQHTANLLTVVQTYRRQGRRELIFLHKL